MIEQKERTGLAAARNLGINHANGEIVSFIDDDGVADEKWIENIVKAFKDAKVSAVGGVVYGTLSRNPTVEDQNKVLFHPNVMDKYATHIVTTLEEYTTPQKGHYPILNGCNMSFKKSVLEETGSFDEYLVNGYDDTEQCIRIFKKGYKIVYDPDIKVRHYPQTNGITRDNYDYYMRRNRIYLCIKNFLGNELTLSKLVTNDLILLQNDIFTTISKHKKPDIWEKRTYYTLRGSVIRSLFKIIIAARIEGYFRGFLVEKR